MKEGTSEGRVGVLSFECQCVFAIEAGAGKVNAAEWEGLDAPAGPSFTAQGVLECSCGQSSFCPQHQAVTIISSFILEIGREEGRGEKKKTWVAHTTTTHCALRTAHPHPTYSIVIAGGTSVQFPVECSVDLSRPAFGRVAQEIMTTIVIITAHVGSALACHHRKQQQRKREQPPRGRAGRSLQGDTWHHFRSYRAAPRSPCWEYNGRGRGSSVILPQKL